MKENRKMEDVTDERRAYSLLRRALLFMGIGKREHMVMELFLWYSECGKEKLPLKDITTLCHFERQAAINAIEKLARSGILLKCRGRGCPVSYEIPEEKNSLCSEINPVRLFLSFCQYSFCVIGRSDNPVGDNGDLNISKSHSIDSETNCTRTTYPDFSKWVPDHKSPAMRLFSKMGKPVDMNFLVYNFTPDHWQDIIDEEKNKNMPEGVEQQLSTFIEHFEKYYGRKFEDINHPWNLKRIHEIRQMFLRRSVDVDQVSEFIKWVFRERAPKWKEGKRINLGVLQYLAKEYLEGGLARKKNLDYYIDENGRKRAKEKKLEEARKG